MTIMASETQIMTDEQKERLKEIRESLDKIRDISKRYDYVSDVLIELWVYRHFFTLYRNACPNHVLVLEADMPIAIKYIVFHIADLVRKAGNDLIASLWKSIDQMRRTKAYRKLAKDYKDACSKKDKERKKELGKQFDEMHEKYCLTKDRCEKEMKEYARKYDIPSVLAQVKADDIWKGVDKVIHGNGRKLHYYSFTDLPSLRGKEITRCIVLHYDEEGIWFSFTSRGKTYRFSYLPGDRFIQDEVNALEDYLRTETAMRKERGKNGRVNKDDRNREDERNAVREYAVTGKAHGEPQSI